MIEKAAEVIGSVLFHALAERIVTVDPRAFAIGVAHSTIHRSRKLRISISQLLTIKSGDKYILISNVRRPERIGPIGGVVRYFQSEVETLEAKIEFDPEFKTGDARYDLRGYIKGKRFTPFLKWLFHGKGRESCALLREIDEELNEIGLSVPAGLLRRPEFHLERTVHQGPFEARGCDYWQYRYFEILSLAEECSQAKLLAEHIRECATGSNRSNKLHLVTAAEIRTGRSGANHIIADSSGFLFSEDRGGADSPPLYQKKES